MASADTLCTAHSPLPWQADRHEVFSSAGEDVSGAFSSNGSEDLDRANAAFIVRACNAHYQMLEALKFARASLAMLTTPGAIAASSVSSAWANCVEADSKVRAAIAAAEAEAGR